MLVCAFATLAMSAFYCNSHLDWNWLSRSWYVRFIIRLISPGCRMTKAATLFIQALQHCEKSTETYNRQQHFIIKRVTPHACFQSPPLLCPHKCTNYYKQGPCTIRQLKRALDLKSKKSNFINCELETVTNDVKAQKINLFGRLSSGFNNKPKFYSEWNQLPFVNLTHNKHWCV